jgi:uncharacterized protein (TIGR02466 family)
MIIETIFTNFIASKKLNLDNQSLEDFCKKIQKDSVSRSVSNRNGFQSFDVDVKHKILIDFSRQVGAVLTEVYQGCELKLNHSIRVSQVWVNVNGKGATNTLHNHPNSIFSGVYYVKADKDSGDIVFTNPNNLLSYTLYPTMIEKYNAFNSGKWRITPEQGNLIIFPSWLSHSVEQNDSSQERISIAFNTEFV